MQTKQAKTQNPKPATESAELTKKAASSAADSTRLPAWTNAWGDQPPALLFPDAELTLQRQATTPDSTDSDHRQHESVGHYSGDQVDKPSAQTMSPAVHDSLRSPGQPLDSNLRAQMESRFDHSFGGVRVHTDTEAAESARKLQAEAFTTGQHIFFGPGRYQPHTVQGQHLLAHELTHTVQQGPSQVPHNRVQPLYTISQPNDPLERQAQSAASRVVTGQAVAPSAISSVQTGMHTLLARQPVAVFPPPEVATQNVQQAGSIAQNIIHRLQSDPEDRSGEVKRLLATLNPPTLKDVLEQVQAVIPPDTLKLLTASPAQQSAAESEESATTLSTSSSSATAKTPEASRTVTEAQSTASSQQTSIGEPLKSEQHTPPETVPMPPTEVEATASSTVEPALAAHMMPKIELATGAAALPASGAGGAALPSVSGVPSATALPVHMPTTSDMQPVVEGSVPVAGAYPTTSADATPVGARPETAASEPTTVPAEGAAVGTAPSTEATAEGSAPEPAAGTAPEVAGPEAAETSTGTEAAAVEGPAGGAAGGPATEGTAAETSGTAGETPSDAVSTETGEVATEPEAPAGEASTETAATGPGETSAEAEAPAAETPSAGAETAAAPTEAGAPAAAEAATPANEPTEPATSESPTGAGGAPESSPSESGTETAPAEQPAEAPASSEAATETGTPTGAAPESTSAAAAAPSAETTPAPEATPTEAATAPETQTPTTGSPARSTMAGGEVAATAQDTGSADEMAGAAETAETEAAPAATGTLESGERESLLSSVAQAPVAQSESAGGGGEGGGGGGAIPDPPAPTIPDVSQAEPAQAVAQVSNLPPAQLQAALGGVSAATTRSVAAQRTDLAASPPQMERPSGSSMTGTGDEQAKQQAQAEAASGKAAKLDATVAPKKTDASEGQPIQPAAAPTLPAPPPPVAAVPAPAVTGDAEGKVTAADAAQLKTALHSLPTTDPGLQVVAEPAPTLVLDGDANPANVQAQHMQLERDMNQAQQQGKQDVAQPMGEQHIYPDVPKETLRAEVPAGGAAATAGPAGAAAAAGGGGATAATASVSDEDTTASIIAQEQKGAEIQAAATQAQSGMVAQQQEHATKVTEERADSQRKGDEIVAQNAQEQQKQRTDAQADVQKQREQTNEVQDKLVQDNRSDAEKKVQDGTEAVSKKQTEGDQEAAGHIKEGNRKAETERTNAEQQARTERTNAEQKTAESGGIFSWLSSKVTGFFNEIKQGIRKVFDAARKAVKGFIDDAKKLAVKAIDGARKFVVDKIREAGNVLIAIGDKVLGDFPELRDKFRSAVKKTVSVATDVVNKLADELKKDVQKALDLLGKGLDAALGLLEKGLLAYVDTLNQAVQGAIKFAKGVAETLGAFAVIIKDIAAGPLKWLSNLGASAKDGIRNHLWKAFKEAIMQWFNQKLEEVLGLSLTTWNILKNGGISLKEIGKMAWEAIKEAIPGVLIQLLIEKLVAMIVPAAGAILTIIEGLQAAWGTIQRIIAAIQAFVDFLKAVKKGDAGPKFAKMLAAAAIVVIDFVANWLLKRLRKPSSGVASRVRAIAQRLGKSLKKVGQAIVKGVKKVAQVVKKAAKAVWQGIKKGAKKVFGALKKAGKWVLKNLGKVGQMIVQGLKKVWEKIKGGVQKVKDWWKKQAFRNARRILRVALSKLISKRWFDRLVKGLKFIFGFKEMKVIEDDKHFRIHAGFSPGEDLVEGWKKTVEEKAAGGGAFVWLPEINYSKNGGLKGILDFTPETQYSINLSAFEKGQLAYHGHHTWPANEMGGQESQPLVGIRGALHNSILHGWLRIYMMAALRLEDYHATEIHQRVAEGSLTYQEVKDELYAFYAKKFPMVPTDAWARGIEYSYKRMPDSALGAQRRANKAAKRRSK